MQIVSIDGYIARCEAKGIKREVNLFMLQDDELVPGDIAKEGNTRAYFRLSKIPCRFKEQARARQSGEKCRLEQVGLPDQKGR